MLKIIKKWNKRRKLKKCKAICLREFEEMIFFQEYEKELLSKSVFTLSRKEYQEYLLLLEIVKASVYAKI